VDLLLKKAWYAALTAFTTAADAGCPGAVAVAEDDDALDGAADRVALLEVLDGLLPDDPEQPPTTSAVRIAPVTLIVRRPLMASVLRHGRKRRWINSLPPRRADR
jgi:hypothetical protein